MFYYYFGYGWSYGLWGFVGCLLFFILLFVLVLVLRTKNITTLNNNCTHKFIRNGFHLRWHNESCSLYEISV